MRMLAIFILIILLTGLIYPGNSQVFTDIMKPESIEVVDDELFIIEGASIYIYSLEDFRLKKKFGKQGEGPQEFKLSSLGLTGHLICLSVFPDTLAVSSESKISYFSRKAEFLREKRIAHPMVIDFAPLAKGFIGRSYKTDGNTPFFSVDLYNQEGESIKEVCKHEIPHYKEGNTVLWKLEDRIPEFKVYKDSIFVAGSGEFVVDVYDAEGKKLREIKQKYQRQEISRQDRDEIIKIWQEDFPSIRRQWDFFKKIIIIRGAFPAIRDFHISDDKIFVQTCKVAKGKTEFFILATDGTFIKQSSLPLVYRNMLTHFPSAIAKNKLYQLVENEETENWELVVTPII